MRFAIPAVSGPAVVGDYAVIEQLLRARARQPLIAWFSWTDNTGHPIASVGPAIRPEAPQWFVGWVGLPFLEQTQPVVVGGERYGTVYLQVDPTIFVNKLWHGFVQRLGILLLGAGVALGVTLVTLRGAVQPLRELAASASRFGQGDYAVRTSLIGPPETAQVSRAFNSMAENIESLLGSLHQSEERNRLLVTQVEQSSDAIFSHDQNGVVTSWNRGAARLYGYDPAEAIGRPLRELDLWQGRGTRGELGARVVRDPRQDPVRRSRGGVGGDDAVARRGRPRAGRARHRARHQLAQAEGSGCRSRQPGEVGIPGHHESRDPHTDERRDRDDGAPPRHHADARAARVRRDRPPIGRGAPVDHQRHSRFLQDRGRPPRAGAGALWPARDDGRDAQDAGTARPCQGARARVRDQTRRSRRPDRRHRPNRPDRPQPGR